MDLPDEESLLWMRGRRDPLLHHIDRLEQMGLPAPTDTRQFSILGINMGNLDRHGQVNGFFHDNMVMDFCCGRFHLALVAEAHLGKRASMTAQTYNVSVFPSKSGAAAIWTLGNGRNRHCETLEQNTVESAGVRQDGGKNWHLDYMVGEVFWGDNEATGHPVTRCGVKSLRCGVAHLNNNSANKKDWTR